MNTSLFLELDAYKLKKTDLKILLIPSPLDYYVKICRKGVFPNETSLMQDCYKRQHESPKQFGATLIRSVVDAMVDPNGKLHICTITSNQD